MAWLWLVLISCNTMLLVTAISAHIRCGNLEAQVRGLIEINLIADERARLTQDEISIIDAMSAIRLTSKDTKDVQ